MGQEETTHVSVKNPEFLLYKSHTQSFLAEISPEPTGVFSPRHWHRIQMPFPWRKQGKGPTLSFVHRYSDKHAFRKIPKAQCAFKILMIHEVLQFALRIAFRCVLHRCGNLDIHR